MNKNTINKIATFSFLTILTACASTGENLKGNVYKAGQVNTAQNARTIRIMSVTPAQIEVDNAEQKKKAQIVGGVVGALAGGLGGGLGGLGTGGTVATTAGGTALGVAAGSLVNDKTLVEGVTIGYMENEKLYTSTQVGRQCEFKVNAVALLISTGPNETRIQPNETCPPEK